MTLLVDTSVWSLALGRDVSVESPQVLALRAALDGAESVFTTDRDIGHAWRHVPFKLRAP